MFRVSVFASTLIFALVVAPACGPADQTIDVTYDACRPLTLALPADATEAQRVSAAEAIEMWNDLGVTHLTLDEMPGEAAVPLRFEDAPGAFHGLYEDESGVVFVNSGMTDDRDRAITIAHELGHAFGLVHVDESDRISVMNKANLVVAPNAEDARAIEAVQGPCGESAPAD